MDKYWVDINGDNESFWEHEWSKHGTCINTIEPSCYTGYESQEEVGDYFQKTVDLFKGLDTYKVRSSVLARGESIGMMI
jgi:ribonuclease T2